MAKSKKKIKKNDDFFWCYIGENKDHVAIVCTREDWESIKRIVEWAKNRLRQDRGDYVPRVSESDEWNYGYTRRG